MRTLKGIIGNALMNLFRVLPVKNKVVFSCFDGQSHGDNPMAIYEEMKRQHPELSYIWLMRDAATKIDGAQVVGAFTIPALYHLATAKLWIDNSRKREWIVKKKNQYYVQTWHGDVCIKKIEKDAAAELGKEYVRAAKHDSKMANLMLSGSDFRTQNYRSAFWYDGEILEYGTPKSEIFYHDPAPVIKKVKQNLGLRDDAKLALYCPTFRSNGRLDVYDIDYSQLLNAMKKRWPGDWYVAVRLHPKIQDLQDEIEYGNHVINGSKYMSTNELIIASDLVVTDYSGCMFAGLEANKKVILYASDLEEYIETNRSLYFEINEMPFPLATDNNQLFEVITNFNTKDYIDKTNNVRKHIGYKTTKDTNKRVVQYVYNKAFGGKA